MIRLHRASLVLTLLAAHQELAALPINWEIDDRDGLWPRVEHKSPDAERAARAMAAALGARMHVDDVNGTPLYSVYGQWAGTKVSLQAFGPDSVDATEVTA
ncbi:hypothetical protein [Streptomyces sp. MCC20]